MYTSEHLYIIWIICIYIYVLTLSILWSSKKSLARRPTGENPINLEETAVWRTENDTNLQLVTAIYNLFLVMSGWNRLLAKSHSHQNDHICWYLAEIVLSHHLHWLSIQPSPVHIPVRCFIHIHIPYPIPCINSIINFRVGFSNINQPLLGYPHGHGNTHIHQLSRLFTIEKEKDYHH